MVPVLYETGSVIAYILYTDSTGILQELNGCKAIPRQYAGHYQAMARPLGYSLSPIMSQGAPFVNSWFVSMVVVHGAA